MSSRRLTDLSNPMMAACAEFELQLQAARIDYVRACTYRSDAEQNLLYAQGRTSPGLIVTHAQAGQSKHNHTLNGRPAANAADYYPMLHGKLCGDQTLIDLAQWERLGKIAIKCGLVWGGNWSRSHRDRPHVELAQALTPD